MAREAPRTIAILGGNTVAGIALALLLKRVGYETRILKAPPPGWPNDLTMDVDLLLLSPGLGDDRRQESMAVLRSVETERRVPVLAFSSAVEEGLFSVHGTGTTWPVEISGLVRGIEAALAGKAQIGPFIVANPFGKAALS